VIPANHVHVSERESAHFWPDGRFDDKGWEDCLWVAAVEVARLCFSPAIPATHKEAEALRADSGEPPDGGSNTTNLRDGIKKRYRWTEGFGVVTGFAELWAALVPGTAAVVAGSFAGFPYGHPLRRWDPTYIGGHAVTAIRVDDGSAVWWCDGLAPAKDYRGQWVTKAQLERFVNSFAGRHFVAPMLSEDAMPALVTNKRIYDIAAGVPFYESPDDPAPLGTFSAATAVECTHSALTPDGKDAGWRLLNVVTSKGVGGKREKGVWVRAADCKNGRQEKHTLAIDGKQVATFTCP
jgi:hypothetical protein